MKKKIKMSDYTLLLGKINNLQKYSPDISYGGEWGSDVAIMEKDNQYGKHILFKDVLDIIKSA